MTQTYRHAKQILERIEELEDLELEINDPDTDPDELAAAREEFDEAELTTLREFIGEVEHYHDPRYATLLTEDDEEEVGRDYVSNLEHPLPDLILAQLNLRELGATLMADYDVFEMQEGEIYYVR